MSKMRAEAFSFPYLFAILAIVFALYAPSVVAAPSAAPDLEESASKPGLKLSGLLGPSLEHRQRVSCGPVTGAKYVSRILSPVILTFRQCCWRMPQC